MTRFFLTCIGILFLSAAAWAQSTVTVIGPIVPGDIAQFNSTTVLKDSGLPASALPTGLANPTATAGPTAINGSATTAMRSDAAPAVQKGTNSQFGLVEGDGTTIDCSVTPGICIAKINGIFPTPTRAGDIIYWNGSTWVTLAGNNSGTQILSENASGVPSWTSSGATFLSEPQGRLTLTANTPVMTVTASAQTTLRYDCYIGSQVPYFTGAADTIDTISSCEVTDAMVSAASAGQILNNSVYDVWWVHSGANRICVAMGTSSGGGGGWAFDSGGSNVARGTGYSQLDRTTRPYITNKNAIANCFNGATNYGSVNANQATYLERFTRVPTGKSVSTMVRRRRAARPHCSASGICTTGSRSAPKLSIAEAPTPIQRSPRGKRAPAQETRSSL